MRDRFTKNRLARNTMQAASLLGLVACLVSCAGHGGSASSDSALFARPRVQAGWVADVPARCAVGSSGPTLNPRNAIRHARAAAIDALASGSLDVDVLSLAGERRGERFDYSAQSLSGSLADGRIAAIWADTRPLAPERSRVERVHALACWPDASLDALPLLDHPRWLIEPPSDAANVCATGLAGPTWRSADQPVSALRDARLSLAIALESRIEKRVIDDGHGVARIARVVEPSSSALARAARAEALEASWYDAEGRGPLGLPRVLYGLVCIEE